MPSLGDLPIEIILEVIEFVSDSYKRSVQTTPPQLIPWQFTPVNVARGRIHKDVLCELRLVSRDLNALVTPALFSELSLFFSDVNQDTAPDCTRCQEIITALASRSTQVFNHTKRLYFRTQSLYWNPNDQRAGVVEMRRAVTENVFDAISALKNLRTVSQVLFTVKPTRTLSAS